MRQAGLWVVPATALLLAAVSPRFNDNFVIESPSINGAFTVTSTPYFCSNRSLGCVKVVENKTKQTLYSFQVSRFTGCVFIGATDPSIIVKVPTGIGLSPLVPIREPVDAADVYIRVYQAGRLVDSLLIPAVRPTPANKRYFFTGRRLDRSKLLHVRADTLVIVTHQGLALLACREGRVRASLARGYERLRFFRPLLLNARLVCFPYPQPSSCAEVPSIPEVPAGRAAKKSRR